LKIENPDVLIIGAGAAGAAAAWSLSETNLKIVCLEQGAFMNPDEYPSAKVGWEAMKYDKFNVSPNVRKLQSDYPINDLESPIAIANFNAVGGSTILYSGHFPRFHPSDFKVNELDGVADDWPMNYYDLEPFFNLNDKMMGVSGLSGDPAYPNIEGMFPPIPFGEIGEVMAKGFNKLGWHWWPSYSAIITREYMHRGKCINLGPCNMGCPQGAKSSTDITYWPLARRKGVELRTNCRVREITVDQNGKLTGAIYYDENGKECFQSAKIILVACNGVGTPRLLLNSKSKVFPEGLANRNGLVGKNLMLHPLGYVEGLFEQELNSNLGPHGCLMQSQEFYETDKSRGFVRGYTMQLLRGPGPIETIISGVNRRDIPLGLKHYESVQKTLGKNIGIGIIVEDLPELHNTVTLDSDLKDSNGIPAPKINYILSENSKKMLAHGIEKSKEVMLAAGAYKTLSFGPVRNTGWHLMGTARMGKDPNNSVVNQFGEAHDVKGLYIIDSSVFVTSGGVNPASTLQAVALYICDQIKKNNNLLNG
jgi:choline dehydrogenase-like flavoprotein